MLKRRPSDFWSAAAAFLLCLLLAPAGRGAGEIILHLKNGDRISGTIRSETTNQVTISSPYLGTVQVPIGEIRQREAVPGPEPKPAPAPVAEPPAAVVSAVTNAPPSVPEPAAPTGADTVASVPASGAITNAPATPSSATNAVVLGPPPPPPEEKKETKMEPANPEATPIAETPRYWKHELRFGLNLRYAAKDNQEIHAIAKSTYGKPPFRHIFDVNYKHGRTEGVLSANSLAASEKTEYQFSPSSYVFGLVGGGYDEIRRIDIQYELGPGFGRELLKKTNFVWKAEGGFNFQQQFRADDITQTHYSLRLAQIFAWQIWDKLTADAKFEFFPNLEDVGDYRLRIESTLRYPITDRLSLNLDVINLYETSPAPGVTPNDLQIRSTIGVKF